MVWYNFIVAVIATYTAVRIFAFLLIVSAGASVSAANGAFAGAAGAVWGSTPSLALLFLRSVLSNCRFRVVKLVPFHTNPSPSNFATRSFRAHVVLWCDTHFPSLRFFL